MASPEILREKLGFARFTRMSRGQEPLAVVLPVQAMAQL